MCRVKVKEGRVQKPSLVPAAAPPRRRGRPAIDWTRSRKRRLLRLYLCTPEAELSLKKILGLLSEGPFQPKPRHTQCLLNDMLSKSYRQKRPKNRTTMSERLAFLRSARCGQLQTDLPPHADTAKECAILLQARPGSGRLTDVDANADVARARTTSGEPDEPDDSPCSPFDRRPPGAIRRSSPDAGKPPPPPPPRSSLESGVKGVSPAMFRNPWSTSCEDGQGQGHGRCERVEFLRERCPSRSSSFLADVVSLLGGLSIRSSLSRSSSGSSRGSARSGSVSERVGEEVPALGLGMMQGGWEDRPSSVVSTAESLAWSGDVTVAVAAGLDEVAFSPCAWPSQPSNHPYNLASSPHTLENQELVRFCCGRTSWCIHQRINAVLMHGSPAETFACTATEVNSRDGLGNTALHVAARWGAPGPVLSRILTLASHPATTNHRGETFLHVLDPTALTPLELTHLTKRLTRRGGFDFTQLDEAGQSFASRLLSRSSFSLDALEAVFGDLPEPARLALLFRAAGGPPHQQQLLNAVRARLAADPAQTAELVEEYCAYFVARYGTPAGSFSAGFAPPP
ncbi:hypothetical protein CHGG_05925 [Chaetomium globosum CBS 148.51]|uniref:Uncharacterized protein n=1 Tax=Chaetomium globosum (strain ATCC 6205 / CBS 148.51 / DSM 1962 / NBRC 6347 / NRRL 1970) TaxID=306901 RepID=Q2H5Z0_CHAGB|nr:uncharacterized protein CHGG_05925 [Chaetomium globosum CBS 148.51]EAQ89306.1 hypothetical protein CHGG_05925 [Chaetomium globosum CBS 148.51]